jgi:hypothetical protein
MLTAGGGGGRAGARWVWVWDQGPAGSAARRRAQLGGRPAARPASARPRQQAAAAGPARRQAAAAGRCSCAPTELTLLYLTLRSSFRSLPDSGFVDSCAGGRPGRGGAAGEGRGRARRAVQRAGCCCASCGAAPGARAWAARAGARAGAGAAHLEDGRGQQVELVVGDGLLDLELAQLLDLVLILQVERLRGARGPGGRLGSSGQALRGPLGALAAAPSAATSAGAGRCHETATEGPPAAGRARGRGGAAAGRQAMAQRPATATRRGAAPPSGGGTTPGHAKVGRWAHLALDVVIELEGALVELEAQPGVLEVLAGVAQRACAPRRGEGAATCVGQRPAGRAQHPAAPAPARRGGGRADPAACRWAPPRRPAESHRCASVGHQGTQPRNPAHPCPPFRLSVNL